MKSPQPSQQRQQRGVSLIEVLIAILIIAIGVLGIAKMQVMSISNSKISGSRNLISLQAASMASLLHSSSVYWQVSSPGTPNCNSTSPCNLSGASTTIFGTACAVGATCATPAQIVAYEINTWMANINQQVPSYAAKISCSVTATTPTTCMIEITWQEKQTGSNATTAALATAQSLTSQSYFLYVTP